MDADRWWILSAAVFYLMCVVCYFGMKGDL